MTAIDGGTQPRRPSPLARALYAIPVLGWIARDLRDGGPDTIYYLLVAVVTLLVVAVMTWGLPALTLTAVALVPVIFILLIWISAG